MTDTVTCDCCGETQPFTDVYDSWHPGVFDGEECVGTLCAECADILGIRDAESEETFGNCRIVRSDLLKAVAEEKARHQIPQTIRDFARRMKNS